MDSDGMIDIRPHVHYINSMRNRNLGWEKALAELIDNAFDHKANQVKIAANNKTVIVIDDGAGVKDLAATVTSDPIAFALSCNLHRRHLTTSQRSMVAAKLATLKRGEAGNGRKVDGSNDLSTEQAATMLNVSEPTVKRAKQVIEHGSKDVIEAVETGEIPVSLAAKLVTEQPNKREQAAIVKHGPAAVRDYLQDEPSPVPTREEESATNNLAEFKKVWLRCSQAGKAAIRIWIDENYLS